MIEVINGVKYDSENAISLSYREITDGPHYLGCSVAMQTKTGEFFECNTRTEKITPKSKIEIADWMQHRTLDSIERAALANAGIMIGRK